MKSHRGWHVLVLVSGEISDTYVQPRECCRHTRLTTKLFASDAGLALDLLLIESSPFIHGRLTHLPYLLDGPLE